MLLPLEVVSGAQAAPAAPLPEPDMPLQEFFSSPCRCLQRSGLPPARQLPRGGLTSSVSLSAPVTTPSTETTIGMGVVCTSPGSGGVDSGSTGSGGGTLGLVAIGFPSRFGVGRAGLAGRLCQFSPLGQRADHGLTLFIPAVRG